MRKNLHERPDETLLGKPLELNEAHFDPAMVSLPLRVIPMDIAPPAQERHSARKRGSN
jgi:hypothetical protein